VILANTSIWVDHFRGNNEKLVEALLAERIVCHPLIVAELALGSLRDRGAVLSLLDELPRLPLATPAEVRAMIEARSLHSRGIGYVDASLIASCLFVPGTSLWTLDRKLSAVASALDLGEQPSLN